jgi:hypothetical protein
MPSTLIQSPPRFCQSAGGQCDQSYEGLATVRGTFLYASEPLEIAQTIEGAVRMLQYEHKNYQWRTWRDFGVTGQLIFSQICKAIRFTDVVFADVTTLNFNVMFEIGFALGLEQPIVPIRDTSWTRHRTEFEQLGLLDTIGYIDFQNAAQLSSEVWTRWHDFQTLPSPKVEPNLGQPVYVVKGPLSTDGEIRLLSDLKKSVLHFRSLDVVETPRVSLYEIRKQTNASYGVVAHLLNPEREGALVHNARCALVAGMAMAQQKSVLLVAEGQWRQPVDYRDLVASYSTAAHVTRAVEPFIRSVFGRIQDARAGSTPRPERFLERLDLGEVAAENEIRALRSYFVQTAQFNSAKRGTARLLTGRKGAGKTAIFYAVRDAIPRGHATIVLDLKPEGYQFAKLRDAVLGELAEGMQEHTLTAFWEYVLLCELAHKIEIREAAWAERDSERLKRYQRVVAVYNQQPSAEIGDFSERLLRLVEVVSERFTSRDSTLKLTGPLLTETLFRGGIRQLQDAIGPYLEEKDAVFVLLDNIDKGWPTHGARAPEILIIRALLEATRKLEHHLDQKDVNFHVLVCLRNDIHELLVRSVPDRGKDTQISLDYDDLELFKEIVRKRLLYGDVFKEGSFDELWAAVFPVHVNAQDAFQWVMDRTLMRPRDLLNFLRRATEVALNRGHERVFEEDMLAAEKAYSEDTLHDMTFELRDTYPDFENLLYAFIDTPARMSREKAIELIRLAEIPEADPAKVLDALVWFGFLGTTPLGRDEPTYAYQVRYNVEKLMSPIRAKRAEFVLHPAFRRALNVSAPVA